MRFTARWLVVFGFVTLLLTLLPPLFSSNKAFAQANYPTQQQTTKVDIYANTNPDVARDMHSYAQIAFVELSSTLICQLIGIDVINPDKGCIGLDPVTKKLGYVQQNDPSRPQLGGLFGFTTNMISAMYVPPASTGQFIGYLKDSFGITHSVHAQQTGAGFQGLGAVQKLFITFRNLVYILLVIIFVIVGIAIMLRVKIDPRTVMTIQNQIPKLIIAIVLVTFSYAIVGLMIDLMWTFTYFGINIILGDSGCGTRALVSIGPLGGSNGNPDVKYVEIATQGIVNNPIAFARDLLSDAGCFGSADGIGGLAWRIGGTLGDIMSRTILGIIGLNENPDLQECGWSSLIPFYGAGVGGCIKGAGFGLLKYLISIAGFLIILIGLYAALFKIWLKLLKAYVIIIIGVILAPLWIIAGVLPGSSGQQWSFAQWMRHMGAHLALFPATVFMFLLASVIARGGDTANNPVSPFLPPLIGNPNIADNLGWITAFAFIMITPDVLEVLRDALKTPVGKYTGNITKRSRAFSPGDALGKYAGYAYGMQMLRQSSFVKPFLKKDASVDAHGASHPPPGTTA
ncbi:MAG: hypothetical protein Q8Q49_03255 [bacterium]|nr:hypothetical protein [bacterium]